jgi:hypothetical protein
VDWLAETQKMVILKAEKIVNLTIGEKTFNISGQDYPLDAPAVIENNRTMVPLRFVSEALGAEVNWKQDSKGGVVDISF